MKKIIRDPVLRDIVVTEPVILELMKTFEFQRLRRIYQLGLSFYIFPGATHNRMLHSIGTYELVRRCFEECEDLKQTSDYDKKVAMCAGLLHDIGHGPFSHSFEKFLNNVKSHEFYSAEIITKDTNITKVLKAHKINPLHVAQVIQHKYKNTILSELISSQIDCDRMDYLVRDAYYTGTNYGVLDTSWLIKNMYVRNKKICFAEKAIPAIENYLIGRYHVYSQVYLHKKNIALEFMIKSIMKRTDYLMKNKHEFRNPLIIQFKEIWDGGDINLETYLKLDDWSFNSLLVLLSYEDDDILRTLCNAFLKRNIFNVKFVDSQKEVTAMAKKYSEKEREYYFGKEFIDISGNRLYKKDEDTPIKIIINDKIKDFSEVSFLTKKISSEVKGKTVIIYK